jgi:peptidase E
LKKGKIIFTGTSAGSMVASPTLYGVKEEESDLETTEKSLFDLKKEEYIRLNFANLQIVPHFNSKDFLEYIPAITSIFQ